MTDLSVYTGETMQMRVEWAAIWSAPDVYYVDEVISNELGKTRWGPIPSKELAHALIRERRQMFETMLREKIPVLRDGK